MLRVTKMHYINPVYTVKDDSPKVIQYE